MMDRNAYKGKHKSFGIRSLPHEEEEMKSLSPVLLFVMLEAPTYSSGALSSAFRSAGYDVEIFDWQKIKFNEGVDGMRDRLLAKAQMCQPDVIFMQLQNAEAITVEIAQELAKRSFVINYTFDVRDDERMLWMDDIAPYIGLTLFASHEDVERCYEKGIKNTAVLQSSCDMEMYRPVRPIKADIPEIVFIGGNYLNSNLSFPLAQERQDMVAFLKKEYGDRFLSMGMGQEASRYINPHEELYAYNSCKIAISQSQYDRTLYTSDRLYRIMASGAFCLAKHFEGITTLFGKVENYLDTWKDFNELQYKIDFYLHNGLKREAIARAGCEYVRTHHTWTMRVAEIKAYIQKYSPKI